MVHGYTRGDRCANFLGAVGEILHIDVGGHGSEGDHRVQDIIIHSTDDKCNVLREKMVRKAVKEADDDEDQCVCDHDCFVAQPVNDLAYQRRSEECADGRHGEEFLMTMAFPPCRAGCKASFSSRGCKPQKAVIV